MRRATACLVSITAAAALLATQVALGASGDVITYAGGGAAGGAGDGGPATSASLYEPSRVAVDSAGNLFVADSGNNRIRKVSTSGTITTVAGNGFQGYSGDGGPATNASLYYPTGVAVDSAGNLFIADTSNHRVRKVSVSGTITTVAGNGIGTYLGDGIPAVLASLSYPTGVAVDAAANLFIADSGNQRIRKVGPEMIITTVAGFGVPQSSRPGEGGGYSGDGGPAILAHLSYPRDVAVDSAGDIFIADTGNLRIRKVSTSGTITTVAGNGYDLIPGYSGDGGPATSANLNGPEDVAVDAAGNLFIADRWNHRIRKVNTAGMINTVAGNSSWGSYSGDGGPATSAGLDSPSGVTVDVAGSLFIADTENRRIRTVSASGTITTVAGIAYGYLGDGGPATSADLWQPEDIAVDAAGNVFIADTGNNRIRKVSTSGTITTVAGRSTPGGGYYGDGGPATSADLTGPRGVAVDAAGNLFIADTGNNVIRKVDTSGTITTVAGTFVFGGYSGDGGPATSATMWSPDSVAVDAAGNLFIADTFNNVIRKVDTSGTITTMAGNGSPGYSGDGEAATSASLYGPSGVALDSAGNLLIVDNVNNVIRKVSESGTITTVAGNGVQGYSGDGGPATSASLYHPRGIAVDSAGNFFIADTASHRVRKVSPSGTITTVAGSGVQGYSGDGGPATSASLNRARGVAVDATGNLFIADTFNNRIRKVAA